MNNNSPLASIMNAYRETNVLVLKAIHDLSDDQLRWRPDAACHSSAFIVWHLARWTDHLQATIPGMTEELAHRLPAGRQIWDQERLAARWGFDAARLGIDETGTDAAIEALGEPAWPEKALLIDYARRAFSAAEEAIAAIDEEQFQAPERKQYDDDYIEASRARSGTVGNALMSHMTHNSQHLGELDCLAGLLKHARIG
jgi:hypothetical protein